jgi:hypothetical protein
MTALLADHCISLLFVLEVLNLSASGTIDIIAQKG